VGKGTGTFLIDKGIQARLDKFHLRRGMDLPQVIVRSESLKELLGLPLDERLESKECFL
jgi:hypothetical protein